MNLNKIYQKIFTRQKVGRQLMSIYISTLLIPILIVGIGVFSFSRHQIIQGYNYQTKEDALRVRSILLTTTMYLHNIYETLSTDNTLNQMLSADYATDEDALMACSQYTQFQTVLEKNPSLSTLQLYTQPDMLRGVSDFRYFIPITDEVRQSDWYVKISENKGGFWKSNLRTDTKGNQHWELSFYCQIPVPQTSSYGILVMTVSNNYLHNLINDKNYHIFLSVNEDPIFYSTKREYAGTIFPVEEATKTSHYSYTGKMTLFEKKVISSTLTLTPYRSSDQIQILSVDTTGLPYIHRIELAFACIIIFSLLIPLIIVLLFTGFFTARIQTLRLAMHKVSVNDYEIVDSFWGDDELSATFTDLKTMVSKIKKTEARIYEAQIKEQNFSNQQQQMELKLLSSQINPHFLYNTLETIRMKAFSEGNQEVANAIKLLGKSMRYALTNTSTTSTTLDKELDHVVTYLSIQQLRFGSRLSYHIRVPEDMDLSQYQILPLLLQPVVENAISHGMEATGEDGHLIIRIRKLSDVQIQIDIFDNGAGIPPEKLIEVETHLTIPPDKFAEHGIGLYNINNRIKLYYGDNYGLQIHSRPGAGTLVTLTLPL